MERLSDRKSFGERTFGLLVTKIDFGPGFGAALDDQKRTRSETFSVEGTFEDFGGERCVIMIEEETREPGNFLLSNDVSDPREGIGVIDRWTDEDSTNFGDGIRYWSTIFAEPSDLDRVRAFLQLPHTRDSLLLASIRVSKGEGLRRLPEGKWLPIVGFSIRRVQRFQPDFAFNLIPEGVF